MQARAAGVQTRCTRTDAGMVCDVTPWCSCGVRCHSNCSMPAIVTHNNTHPAPVAEPLTQQQHQTRWRVLHLPR